MRTRGKWGKQKRRKGRAPTSYAVSRKSHLKRAYGISPEDFERMKSSQGGLCAICLLHMKAPYVDHDHLTGKVRGLLCSRCNSLLAGVERREWLMSAKRYLRNAGTWGPIRRRRRTKAQILADLTTV
jgi:hypothetical protein